MTEGLESDKGVCPYKTPDTARQLHTCGLESGHVGDHRCPLCGEVWARGEETIMMKEPPL